MKTGTYEDKYLRSLEESLQHMASEFEIIPLFMEYQ